MEPLTTPAAQAALYGSMDAKSGDAQSKGHSKADLPKLGKWTLAVILFFNVSGGPFMSENAVVAAGPLFAVLGFLFTAIFYSSPAALLTAELSTTYPEDAGIVAWVTAAFGPTWGTSEGLLFWLYGGISLAPYPLMLLDYIRYVVCPGVLAGQVCEPIDSSLLSFLPSNGVLFVIFFVLANTYLSWKGVEVVGAAAIILVAFVLLPFVVMCFWGLPHVDPSIWLRDRPFESPSISDVNWMKLMQTLFWCMNYWDSASTTAGETDNPNHSIPAALKYCLLGATCVYIIPILICTACLPQQKWYIGFWVSAGYEIGGHFLQYWILIAGIVSMTGQFLAGHTTVAYEVLGMAEVGQMPKLFLERNKDGVPIYSLLLSTAMVFLVLAVSDMRLAIPVAMCNGVYCVAELITYATFLYLRWYHNDMHRPFRVPFGFFGCIVMLIIPATISFTILADPFVSGKIAPAVGIVITLFIAMTFRNVMNWFRTRYPDSFLHERQSEGKEPREVDPSSQKA